MFASDPLQEEQNKVFSVEFLTRFMIKGYGGSNKIDITDSDFSNIENVHLLKQEKTAVDSFETVSSNILLYKTLFRTFSLQLKLLALKKLSPEG